MRISDWSSDVCSSDLVFSRDRGNKHEKFDLEACTTVPGEGGHELIGFGSGSHPGREWILRVHEGASFGAALTGAAQLARAEVEEIGRASCRERVCQYV